MKKLILFFLLISSFGAMAQNQDAQPYGGIFYNDQSNVRNYGANALPRTDHANIDTLTNVIKGDLRFDTLNRHPVVFDGSSFQDVAFGRVRDTSITIATAAVLTLNSSPVVIVSAQGVGYVIEVISATVKMDYSSVAYATNTDLGLIASGGSAYQAQWHTSILSATGDRIVTVSKVEAVNSNMVDNGW